MHLFTSKASRLIPGISAFVLLLASHASFAQLVNLTAAPTSTTLPDGQTVPMWGYQCADKGTGATCAAANPNAGTGWSPLVITVPYLSSGTNLTINLTNSLGNNKIPTSLVIVGQVGGGLEKVIDLVDLTHHTTTTSPTHSGQGVTWPTPNTGAKSTPPAQLPRVQSFGTEVLAGNTAALTWTNLRPGTYLIESGTHPSIQVPMGLYGILVVTTPVVTTPVGTTPVVTTPGQAYPTVANVPTTAASVYDADLPVVLSEIDPVQNAAVATAVATAGFSETAVWSAQAGYVNALTVTNGGSGYISTASPLTVTLSGGGGTGATATATVTNGVVTALTIVTAGSGYTTSPTVSFSGGGGTGAAGTASIPASCGNSSKSNPAANTCYPPAVNYSPVYYLVNGVSFDRTNLPASVFAPASLVPAPLVPGSAGTPVAATTGNVVVRLVNAGLRMHVPAIVNMPMTLLAEDGNPLPGQLRLQNEVFLAAGKTYDVLVKPAQTADPTTTTNNYTAATYPIFDRQLSLSTNNQRDGGMQAYIAVAGGASSGVGTKADSGIKLSGVVSKTFYCVTGTTLSITDPASGLLGGITGANGVVVTSTSTLAGTLVVQSNGTFIYTPPAAPAACGGKFTYLVNNSSSVTSTIAECDASTTADSIKATGCVIGGKPKLADDSCSLSTRRACCSTTSIPAACPWWSIRRRWCLRPV
jgi:hypothetical protein